MVNKINFGLLIVLFSVLLEGCKYEKQTTLSKEDHCSEFFPFLNEQTILNYQFMYRSVRGAYVTLAKVTMSTNSYYLLLQNQFSKIIPINQPPEQDVYYELLWSRAASLVGGTNNIPIWFNPKRESIYKYMDKIDSTIDQRIWLDERENTIYFIATGKGDVTSYNQRR